MDFEYIGDELELFRHAQNWKKYYGEMIKPFFGAKVLEVGAGSVRPPSFFFPLTYAVGYVSSRMKKWRQ
jgi:hypothetical protein